MELRLCSRHVYFGVSAIVLFINFIAAKYSGYGSCLSSMGHISVWVIVLVVGLESNMCLDSFHEGANQSGWFSQVASDH